MKTYSSFKKELLRDQETRKMYEDAGPQNLLIQMIIERRLESGLTQVELANRMGTKQSAISRFERGAYNPTISFLRRLASALDAELLISIS